MFIFKTTWKSYCNNNDKIPGNLLKNLEKSWKYHGILSVRKSGNPGTFSVLDSLQSVLMSAGPTRNLTEQLNVKIV